MDNDIWTSIIYGPFFPSHLVDSVMVYKNKDILTKEDKEKGSVV